MEAARLRELAAVYRDGLLNDTMPFWIRHAVDRECGGFLTCLDRDGSVLDTDKPIWLQGRFVWTLATLYRTVESRAEWLELARHGLEFLRRHAFDADGRMFFLVTREGKPLRKRRYVYSEMFAVMALAAYAKAAGDEQAAAEARDLWQRFLRYMTTPGLLEPKTDPATRPMKGLGGPMATVCVAQAQRETIGGPGLDDVIDRAIDEVERDFMKPDLQVCLETVGPRGEILDHFDGRTLNPGHAIEVAWFILHEARVRGGDARLVKLGTTILDWMWQRGWDTEFGGLFYFRDLKGLPVQEYWQDMKFWWPHNEAVIATLLASTTGPMPISPTRSTASGSGTCTATGGSRRRSRGTGGKGRSICRACSSIAGS
jgi:N-acylglucosamine 2-epimerase